MIRHEKLLELLSYDALTGVFTWRVDRTGSAKAGTVAGTLRPDGYRSFIFDGTTCMGARVAWFYQYGEWPKNEIDHINGIRSDDRILNLREASPLQNSGNRKRRIDNAIEFKGVHKRSDTAYRAMIRIYGKLKHLGTFRNPTDAAKAYDKAARQHFGEFARTNFLEAA